MAADGPTSPADVAVAAGAAVAAPATAPVPTEGSASVADDEHSVHNEGNAVTTPPTGATAAASSHGAIGSAIAVGSMASQTESRPSSRSVSETRGAEADRNVRRRLDVAPLPPLAAAGGSGSAITDLPAARVSTMWQVSRGDGWWQDCSPPFSSALEAQFQAGIPVARFPFFGNTYIGRIDYTHDLVQCQQFNHYNSQYKQIRRLTVNLGS
jgi:hypothetical protein